MLGELIDGLSQAVRDFNHLSVNADELLSMWYSCHNFSDIFLYLVTFLTMPIRLPLTELQH